MPDISTGRLSIVERYQATVRLVPERESHTAKAVRKSSKARGRLLPLGIEAADAEPAHPAGTCPRRPTSTTHFQGVSTT